MGEFNLDTGSQFTAQAYDISVSTGLFLYVDGLLIILRILQNIQGFTQSMQIGADGCATVTCPVANCGCENGYAPGDLSGCGADLPVKACGPGPVGFTSTGFLQLP